MRLVIDLQGAQSTGSRNRGIGRYSLSLAQGLVRNRGNHEVLIALNGLFPETIEPIRAAFEGMLPQENIRVWTALGPVFAADAAHYARREAAELIREQFLASLSPDAVIVTSLFEGLGDDAVTSVGALSGQVPTAVILYDLIPLIHRKIYLQNPVVEQWYENKLDHMRRADLLLSISASSGKEGIQFLGFNPGQVTNISTAAEDHFMPGPVSSEARASLASRYGLKKPFVMYTGGIDHRKNIEGLIGAYAKLPTALRRRHQLAVVCSIQPPERKLLLELARGAGLEDGELILTGFVPEEDLLACYRACKMFIFPSWHEGFGLPALEAMHCGRAVIAANTSSLPEVVGHKNALFDPFDLNAIASKMAQVLEDDSFRAELERHSAIQARRFSWDNTALQAWQALTARVSVACSHVSKRNERPRLAFLSPLPPEPSGISDYSAELLPELARHYKIEVIVAQEQVSDAYVRANCPIRTVDWFREHAHEFDRILYHFGNSHFHSHMVDLLRAHPGVVVLHDFFLSGLLAYRDVHGLSPGAWARALLKSHDWSAVAARFSAANIEHVMWDYPANLEILQEALGVIVHSDYARQLAKDWYGHGAPNDWQLIPLMRKPVSTSNRAEARRALGIPEESFLVCSFGHLGPTKLNHRLLSAWNASALASDSSCRLVFVGQNHGGEYGAELVRSIRETARGSNIEITGWTESDAFHLWLAAADVGVQLRTLSRGETSAAVLDCMNHGLATIVNANGSSAELEKGSVWLLDDDFQDADLIEALTTLHDDQRRRARMAMKARQVVAERHAPRRCAAMYAEAIERYYDKAAVGLQGLVSSITTQSNPLPTQDWPSVAASIATNSPPTPRRKQLLIDISALHGRGLEAHTDRVTHAILHHCLLNSRSGWQVEPIYAVSNSASYRYARRFASELIGVPEDWASDDTVEAIAGDVYFGLAPLRSDLTTQSTLLKTWRDRGVNIQFMISDLLPIYEPALFPSGTDHALQRWLETVALFDGAICTSRTLADEFQNWLQVYGPKRMRPLDVRWFNLGFVSTPTLLPSKLTSEAQRLIEGIKAKPSFLTVGVIEPRNAQAQVLSAFELLWSNDFDANLIFVGKPGWGMDDVVTRMRSHAEFGNRLFWLTDIDDHYLHRLYAACTCVIAAGIGDGSGMPVIEAAQHKRPLISRDISVFREVAGEGSFYFPDKDDPEIVALAVEQWIALHHAQNPTTMGAVDSPTLAESAEALLENVLSETPPYRQWRSDGILRIQGNDQRCGTQVGKRRRRTMYTTGEAGFLSFGPYLPLAAGRYHVRAWGGHSHFVGTEHLDSISGGGARKYCNVLLKASTPAWRVTADIEVPENVTDFEVRLWVDAETDLWLDGIEIVPEALLDPIEKATEDDARESNANSSEKSKSISSPAASRRNQIQPKAKSAQKRSEGRSRKSKDSKRPVY